MLFLRFWGWNHSLRDARKGCPKYIYSFKPTSTREIYEKWGKGICEFCDEQLEETELSGHDGSHMECSMLIFNQGMKDELMVNHKMTVEAENVEDEDDVNVQELRDKDGDQEKGEVQLTEAQIPLQLPDLSWKSEAQLTELGEKAKYKERTRETRKEEEETCKESIEAVGEKGIEQSGR